MADIDDVAVGKIISFQSKAVNDNNHYYGKVVGSVTSDIAKTYADIYTYNTSVQSADVDVPDVVAQEFLLIRLLEKIDDSEKYMIPFSKDWISGPSLQIIASNRVALFRVYEVDTTNSQDIINLLKTAGFKARIEKYE